MCTICARGGSKGVPNKNIRLIDGIPLIAHSVRQALATGLFERVAVSSDSDAILTAAEQAGALSIVKRPADLANDTAAKIPAIQHCVRQVEQQTGITYDIFCDLDATSPLRLPSDIVGAVSLLQNTKNVECVITGCPSRRSPYFNMVERGNQSVNLCQPPKSAIVRRQDAPQTFDMNASVYVWTRKGLFDIQSLFGSHTRLFEMPDERSMDIDSELDFAIVKALKEGTIGVKPEIER